jgi:ribosomal protein S18 acetylase RimI-like enzyme
LSPEVRRAEADDAPQLARLLHDFNSEFDEETPGVEALTERFRRLIEDGELTALLIGDGPDGFVQLRFRSSLISGAADALLEELYVVPDRRGEGLGRALLEAAMETSRDMGATRIELGTSEDDVAARALYESTGFTNREGRPDGPVMFYYERDL